MAAALFSCSFDLAGLAKFLKTPSQKLGTNQHGARLKATYVRYALQDVQVTWECFVTLVGKYELHQLSQTHLGKVLSEASLGKAYLSEMNVRPWREVQPDFPDELLGIIVSTYYGGRAEVRLRRSLAQVLYCDFLSMYPTVCTLMGLWRFVIAKGLTWRNVSGGTQEFLERVAISDLQASDTWRQLTTLVKLTPTDDIFPTRAKYDTLTPGAQNRAASVTIGLNHSTGEKPLWYTLADVVASKLLTGKTPVFLKRSASTPRNRKMACGR